MPKKSSNARKSVGRRSPLSRAKILEAAVDRADRGGLLELSMRKLAQALGVEAMSLYNHVSNKDDLIDAMVDLVVGEIELPSAETEWNTALRRRAVSAHDVLVRHPWATQPLVSRVNVGPNMLRYVDATLGCLRRAGFPPKLADHAWNAIDSYIYGFTLQKLNFPFDPSEYAGAAEAFLPMLPEDQYPHLNELSREVIDGRHDGLHELEFGLNLILDGLEKLI